MRTYVFFAIFQCIYQGVGGHNLVSLFNEFPLIRDLSVKTVIIEIGSDDLSHVNVDPVNLAKVIVRLAKLVATVDLACWGEFV